MERITLRQTSAWRTSKLLRAAWLASTGLSAIALLPSAAHAQSTLAPNTTPQGGAVAAGSASITQAPNVTTINQSSQRTVINWQSYNVGANAEVDYNQPNANAIALNRVVTPSPSTIAGKIQANGQIVLINQSGVVFTKGSEVNAESIVVSTSNVADKDFMAGKLNFSGAPNPGAKIVNDGSITVKDTGLVGLVAPQVANSGVITAKLGQVVLAGASAFTLDLYGDRLMSIDVTKAVRAVDVGGKPVAALVTNSGMILADGGTITLTAQDADALVTQLVDAGGTIRANSVGSQTGAINISGVGGNITVAGNLLAQGNDAGSTGGAVQVVTDGAVNVAPSAVIDASGDAGGGVVALGTTIQRAVQGAANVTAPRAASVTLATGAIIKADAHTKGNAGKVTLLSAQHTDFAGAISAQGGSLGGNGGMIEISSDGVISLGGTVLNTAINGQAGEVLLDPATLVVTLGGTTAGTLSGGATTFGDVGTSGTSFVDPGAIGSLAGTIILEASTLLAVDSAINATAASALSLVSLGNITIAAGISVTTGSLDINAAASLGIGATISAPSITLVAGSIGLTGGLTATNATLSAPTLSLSGLESVTGNLSLVSSGLIAVTGGTATAGALVAQLNGATFSQSGGNIIAASAAIIGESGSTSFAQTGGTLSAGSLSLANLFGGASQSTAGVINAGTLTTGGTTDGGNLALLGTANNIGTLGFISLSSGTFDLVDPVSLTVAGPVSDTNGDITLSAAPTIDITGSIRAALGRLNFDSVTSVFESGTAAVTASTLSLTNDVGASIILTGTTNVVANLDPFTVTSFAFDDAPINNFAVGGAITASSLISITDVTTMGAFSASLVSAPNITLAAVNDLVLKDTINAGSTGTIAIIGGSAERSNDLAQQFTASVIAFAPYAAGTSIVLDGSANNKIDIPLGSLTFNTLVVGSADGFTANNIAVSSNASVAGSVVFDALQGITQTNSFGAGNITFNAGQGTASGSISIGGIVNAGTLLALNSTGATTDGNNGTLIAPEITFNTASFIESPFNAALKTAFLTGSASAGSVSLTSGSNSFGTLGAISASSSIAITGGSALSVDGPLIAGPGITLSGAGITLAGNLSASSYIGLQSTGSGNQITQTSGSLITSFLSITGSGNVSLAGSANSFGTLGDVNFSNYNVAVSDTGALTAGNITVKSGSFVAGTLDLTGGSVNFQNSLVLSGAGGVTLNEDITSNNGGASLAFAGGGVTQTAGSISNINGLVTASGSLTGSVLLTSSLNSFPTLTGITLSSGTLSVVDDANGGLTAGGLAAPFITLTNDRGTLQLNGDVAGATQVSLALISTNTYDILQSGGSLTTALLSLADGRGNVSLNQAANNIASLGTATVNGNLSLVDTGSLSVNGPVTAATATLSAGTIGINGLLSAGSGITLAAPSGLTEASAGTLITGLLTFPGSISGNLSLTSTHNSINTLGSVTLGGMLDIASTGSLGLTGPVSAAAALFSAPTLAIGALISTSSYVALGSTGTITEGTGGTINTGTLLSLGSIGGGVTLGNNNSIGTLGGFTLGGALDLVDGAALAVTAPVNAGPGITLSGAGIALAGNISSTNYIGLKSTGSGNAINQTAGSLTTSFLSVTGSGNVTLADGTNSFATLGRLAFSGSSVNITDIGSLTLGTIIAGSGTFTAGSLDLTGGVVSFTNTLALSGTNNVTLNEAINGGASSVLSLAGGGVTQSAGGITAGTVNGQGTLTGSVLLTSNNNAFGTLSGITLASGTLAAFDSTSTPTLSAGGLSAPVISLSNYGAIQLNGNVAGATLVALNQRSGSANDVSQTAGSLSTALLDVNNAKGSVSLNQTGNNITALGSSSVNGTLALTDAAALGITSLVSAASGITLTTPAGLSEAAAGGLISGSLSLPGSIAGNIYLTSAHNTLGSLSGITSAGAFALLNQSGLTIAAPINAGSASLTAATGTLAVNASIATTGNVLLSAASAIDLNSNITLTGAGAAASFLSPLVTLAAANTISALGANGDIGFAANTLGLGGTLLANATTGTIALAPFSNTTLIDLGATAATGAGTFAISPLSTADSAAELEIGSVNGSVATGTFSILVDSAGFTSPTQVLGLFSGSSITQKGALGANTLTGAAPAGVTLTLAGNSISTLGAFSASSLALIDTGALTVAGPINAPFTTLSANTLALAGNINAASTLALESPLVSQSAGIITAGTLTSGGVSDGAIILTSANSVTTLGSLTASSLALRDTRALDIAGLVSASSGIVLTGTTLTESTGSLMTPTLSTGSGSFSGGVSLSGLNAVNTLAAFTAGSAFDFMNNTSLAVTGPVQGASVTLVAPSIGISGTVSGTTLVALGGSGNISEVFGGTIITGTLLSAGSIGGGVTLTNANSIGTLGGFTLGGNLSLGDTGTLVVAGPVNAGPGIELTAKGITLAANLSAANYIGFYDTSGPLTQISGSITSAFVSVAGYGNVNLGDVSNSFGTLGALNFPTKNVTIADTGNLTVAGNAYLYTGTFNAGSLDFTGGLVEFDTKLLLNGANGITLNENLIALTSGGALVVGGGGVTQTGGAIKLSGGGTIAGQGTLAGSVLLPNVSNYNFTTLTGITLSSGTLAVADHGNVSASGLSAPVISVSSYGTFNLTGNVSAATALSLAQTKSSASYGITQTAGSVTTALLNVSNVSGGVSLNQPGNSVATLGSSSVSGNLSLTDATALGVTGPVSALSATLVAPTLGLNSALSVTSALALGSTGNITEAAGVTLAAATLISAGSIGGGATLASANNSITTLGGFTLGGAFDLVDTGSLTVTGNVRAQNLTLAVPTLVLSGATLNAGIGAPTLALAANTLTANGSNSLVAPAGTIVLTPDQANGTIDIGGSIAGALNIPASLVASFDPATALFLIGSTPTTAEIDLGGTASFPGTGLVSLTSAGGIFQTAGTFTAGALAFNAASFTQASAAALNAALLAGSSSGDLIAQGTANNIITLGSLSFSPSGVLSLSDNHALTIGSSITAGAITLAAAGLDLAGNLNATRVALGSTGAITQTAGSISTGTLVSVGSIGTGVSLTDANNINTLGGFTLGGALNLVDSAALTVTGPVNAGTGITLTGAGIALAGNVSASSYIGLISTGASNQIIQSLGSLTTALLSLTGQGSVSLAAASNSFTTLGALNLGTNNATIVDAASLTAGNITLASGSFTAGNLDLTGGTASFTGVLALDGTSGATLNETVFGGQTLALAGGGITQTSGSLALAAGTVTASGILSNSVLLRSSGNQIGALTGVTLSTGTLAVADNQALNAGALNAPVISLSSAGAMQLNGNVTAATALTLAQLQSAAANITQSAGSITTALLTLNNANGNVSLNDPGNQIAVLGSGNVNGILSLIDTGALSLSGPVTATAATFVADTLGLNSGLSVASMLTLGSTGNITEAAGVTLTAATLASAGSIGGNAALASANNSIGTLGGFTLGGALNLADTSSLTVTGPVSGANVTLAAPALSISGLLAGTNNVALLAAGSVTELGTGSVTAGTLTSGGGTDGTVQLTGAANSIATLGAFSASSLALTDTGLLTVAGPVVAPLTSLTAGAIALSGNVSAATALALLSTAGGISQTAGAITTALLTSGGGTEAGAVSLGQSANNINMLGGFAAGSNNFTLFDATALTVAGPVTAGIASLSAPNLDVTAPITAAQISLTGSNGITLAGPVSASGLLALTSNGAVNQTGGTVSAAQLISTGAVASASLNQAGNNIATLGNFTATGGLTLADANALSLAGAISTGTTLALGDLAGITQTGGVITAPVLTSDGGIIGGAANFGQAGNQIAALGNFAATGDVTVNDASALALTGNVSDAGQTLNIAASGAVTQNAGAITAAALNVSGAGVTLADPNQITALNNASSSAGLDVAGIGGVTGNVNASSATLSSPANLNLTGAINVNNDVNLIAAGNITQPAGSINASTGNLTATNISLSGTDNFTGQLNFAASGNVTHSGGTLAARILTGTAGTLASFGALSEFGTLGSYILHDSLFSLSNTGNLTVTGPVVANQITIITTGLLTLAGSANGGLFLTGNLAPSTQTVPGPTDSVVQGSAITQSGLFLINTGANSQLYNSVQYLGTTNQAGTLFMLTAPTVGAAGGNIALATQPNGLQAPNVEIVFSAGQSGLITGNVNIGGLLVLGGSSSILTGSIAGLTGQVAAGKGSVFPFPESKFQFNSCPIGSVNCIILPIEAVPTSNPLQNFDISQRKRRRLDKNVQLPGIATHDF